jgi:hypothetical protein
MNKDGFIRSDDALLILHRSVKLSAPSIDNVQFVNVTMPDVHGILGERLKVPVILNNGNLVAGGDICIAYNRSVLRVIKVTSSSNILLVSNINESNTIRISFVCAHGLRGKALAEIEFDIIADETSPLEFRKMALYGSDALPLSFTIKHGIFESWAMKPSQSALLQNFPNPCNPETWIPYQLKDESDVTIRIYSIKGELVRMIKLGSRPAGSYISLGRAAHWDGKDNSGQLAGSGLYFYSIQTSSFSETRKMIVMK